MHRLEGMKPNQIPMIPNQQMLSPDRMGAPWRPSNGETPWNARPTLRYSRQLYQPVQIGSASYCASDTLNPDQGPSPHPPPLLRPHHGAPQFTGTILIYANGRLLQHFCLKIHRGKYISHRFRGIRLLFTSIRKPICPFFIKKGRRFVQRMCNLRDFQFRGRILFFLNYFYFRIN